MIRNWNICLLTIVALMMVNGALGQSAEVKDVRVASSGTTVSIDVELTHAIRPTVSYAKNPDRMIIDFPGVRPQERLHRISVGKYGVVRVRVGLNRANPPVTRVVVDVDALHPFTIEASGDKFLLNILTSAQPLDLEADSDVEKKTDSPPTVSGNAPEESPPRPQLAAMPVSTPDAKVVLPNRQFKIKGISADSVYIDGGSNAGLQQGMRLTVHDSTSQPEDASAGLGELRILAVATTSAIAEVHDAKRPLKRGDWAVLVPADAEEAQNAVTGRVLAAAPLPRSKALIPHETDHSTPAGPANSNASRIQGRIGLDYSGITSIGSTPGSSRQMGISFQSDMTHLFGTHWNLEGYWRGRINKHSQFQEETIQNTLNKTYTMQLYYDNPDSAWVAGFGRLYLPWATSLDTIDGGYLGRKLGHGVTTGVFAGSTPDITSWDYRPDQQISGSFVNISGGSYDRLRVSSTAGLALSMLDWKLDRPYVFFENEASYKNFVSIFHSLIVDDPRGVSTNGIRPGAGISRSYLTIHLQPNHRLSFDIYHNFLRDIPATPTQIAGTGVVDQLLFQGLNVGVHLEAVKHVTVYTTLGRSEKTGDVEGSLNQMYGISWSEIAHTGVRADFHYSKFDSNFATGNYRLLSLSRQMSNRTFWNVQFGTQNLISPFTTNNQSKFVATSMDVNLGRHSFLQSGYTFVNGAALNYRQWYTSWGYRFDERRGETERNPITK